MTINRDGKPFAACVYDAIKQFPEGLASFEVNELFPNQDNPNAVFGALTWLKQHGSIKVVGKRYRAESRAPASVYVATSVSPSQRKSPIKKAKPTDAGWEARIAEVRATVEALESWKADAIKRYPDLAVAPTIIEARKRVAAMFKAEGDAMKADTVMRGLLDQSMIMRALVAAIDELSA